MRRLKLGIGIAAVLLLWLASEFIPPVAFGIGVVEASMDRLLGRAIIRAAGPWGPVQILYRDKLRTDYKVRRVAFAGCILSSSKIAQMDGYNAVSGFFIERKIGEGTLKRVWLETLNECGAEAFEKGLTDVAEEARRSCAERAMQSSSEAN